MKTPRHEILVNRLIDEEITQEEKAELDRLLAESPEARAFYESLSGLVQNSHLISTVAPPPDLRAQVLAGIDHSRYVHRSSRSDEGIRGIMKSVFISRLAYGLAAGVIIGIAIGSLTTNGVIPHGTLIPRSEVSGTLGAAPTNGGMERVASNAFNLDGVSGHLTADRIGSQALIRIQVESSIETEIVLVFGAESVTVRSLEQNADGLVDATIESGSVRLSHAGSNVYVATLRLLKLPAAVSFRVRGGGGIFQEIVEFRTGAE